jgi:hypothetical protein
MEHGKFVLAAGTEQGQISIHTLDPENLSAVSSVALHSQ